MDEIKFELRRASRDHWRDLVPNVYVNPHAYRHDYWDEGMEVQWHLPEQCDQSDCWNCYNLQSRNSR
jgi:hypothetical protein